MELVNTATMSTTETIKILGGYDLTTDDLDKAFNAFLKQEENFISRTRHKGEEFILVTENHAGAYALDLWVLTPQGERFVYERLVAWNKEGNLVFCRPFYGSVRHQTLNAYANLYKKVLQVKLSDLEHLEEYEDDDLEVTCDVYNPAGLDQDSVVVGSGN